MKLPLTALFENVPLSSLLYLFFYLFPFDIVCLLLIIIISNNKCRVYEAGVFVFLILYPALVPGTQ